MRFHEDSTRTIDFPQNSTSAPDEGSTTFFEGRGPGKAPRGFYHQGSTSGPGWFEVMILARF